MPAADRERRGSEKREREKEGEREREREREGEGGWERERVFHAARTVPSTGAKAKFTSKILIIKC